MLKNKIIKGGLVLAIILLGFSVFLFIKKDKNMIDNNQVVELAEVFQIGLKEVVEVEPNRAGLLVRLDSISDSDFVKIPDGPEKYPESVFNLTVRQGDDHSEKYSLTNEKSIGKFSGYLIELVDSGENFAKIRITSTK